MSYHLESKHQIVIKEDEDQAKLDNYNVKKLSTERTDQITKAISDFIAYDMIPYRVVDGEGFKKLIKVLEPRYQIPDRTSFSRTYIPQSYERLKEQIIGLLNNVQSYSVTYDYWTSCSNKSFLTVTAHYLDTYFQPNDFVLRTMEVNKDHTGENTSDLIKDILKDFKLQTNNLNKIWAIADGAANMKKTARLFGCSYIYCFSHLLHNTLTRSDWDEAEGVKGLITKSRELAKTFRATPKVVHKLRDTQAEMKLPLLKLKLDVPTRWHSMFDMLDRLHSNRRPVVSICLDPNAKVKAENLLDSEWETLAQIVQVLSPFKEISDLLCSTGSPTISLAKPIILNIKNSLLSNNSQDTPLIKKIKETMRQDFLNRIEQYKDLDELFKLSTLLDPRVKKILLETSSDREKAEKLILKNLDLYEIVLDSEDLENEPEINHTTKKPKLSDSKLSNIFGLVPVNYLPENNREREIKLYLDEEVINFNEDALIWWKSNQLRYKLLCKLAKIILPIPITSVASERVFSKAGMIISNKRASLSSKNADYLIFCSHNYKKV